MKPFADRVPVDAPAADTRSTGPRAADRSAGDAPTAGLPAPRPAPDDVAGPAGHGQNPDGPPAVEPAPPAVEPAPPAVEAATASPALSDRESAILAFEQQWWKHAGAKEQAIRDAFGLSATRYYQLLNGLLDNPAALAAEPMLIGRLRRLRSTRSRARRR